MRITLAPYDPRWPARFLAARRELLHALDAEWLVAVEHIGSTAVPGLAAKPIIDMLTGVRSLEPVETANAALEALGYVPWFGATGRVSYERRNAEGQATHHVHFVVFGDLLWRNQLMFRDALRTNAADREAYEKLKRELAAKYTDTRDYSEAKGPFVESVLSRVSGARV